MGGERGGEVVGGQAFGGQAFGAEVLERGVSLGDGCAQLAGGGVGVGRLLPAAGGQGVGSVGVMVNRTVREP